MSEAHAGRCTFCQVPLGQGAVELAPTRRWWRTHVPRRMAACSECWPYARAMLDTELRMGEVSAVVRC